MNKGLAYLLLVITFFTNSSMERPKKKKYNRWATRKLKQIAANKNPSNGEIREFVSRGANPNIIARPYNEQWSLLRLAIMRADVDFELVLLLFNRGVNLNDNSGPMQMAIQMRDLDIVERLTAKGADLNLVDYQNQTPLGIAIKYHVKEIIPFLIQHGAEWLSEDIEQKLEKTHENTLMLIRKHHIQKLM